MINRVHNSSEQVHHMFLTLWYDVKGTVWEDSDFWASTSSEQVKEELGYQELPPQMGWMLQPIQDWELKNLRDALMTTFLKSRLTSIVRSDSRDVASTSAVQVVETVRYVHNILCHPPGRVKGLSAVCLTCLSDLLSETLSTLDAALLHLKQSITDEGLCGEDQSNMGSLEQVIDHEHAESLCTALATGSTCTSNCTSNCTEVVSEGVDQWRVEQVLTFFEEYNFPSAGVMTGQVDGRTLLNFFENHDTEVIFTTPVPDGMGFNRIMFIGRFKMEMSKLRAASGAAAGTV